MRSRELVQYTIRSVCASNTHEHVKRESGKIRFCFRALIYRLGIVTMKEKKVNIKSELHKIKLKKKEEPKNRFRYL